MIRTKTISGTCGNLKRVEPVFRNKVTIVIKSQPASQYVEGLSDAYLMKNEKKMMRILVKTTQALTLNKSHQNPNTSNTFGDYRFKPLSYSKEFLGACSVEVQKHGNLIHYHLIIGDILQAHHPEVPYDVRMFQTNQSYLDYIKVQLVQHIPSVYDVDFDRYLPEQVMVDGSSWLSYICKDRCNPYVSPALRSLIKQTNRIDASSGIIPDELKRHKIVFDDERKQKDLDKRLSLCLEKGGETDGNDND